VVGLLGLVSMIAFAFGGFLSVSPNRLARGIALPIWHISPPAGWLLAISSSALLGLAFVQHPKLRSVATLILSGLLFNGCGLAAGRLAASLIQPEVPALRLSLGAAFWVPALCAALAFLHALQDLKPPLLFRMALFALLCTPAAIFIDQGLLDALSLVKEFEAHRLALGQALIDHLVLVGLALVLAFLVALPLILIARQRPHLQNIVYSSLGIIQAVPSIALFGLLIAPLSALVAQAPGLASLGVSGTGRTPAVIALVLYSLLPLVRNGLTGLASAPNDALEAATGLGFTRRERFFQIALPLALPALLSGLRIVTIQAIGLASVAALIGAGGLGTFVFQGIGQYALDLVLVGAIPIILLALSADLCFQLLLSRLRTGL
jgi:osmoprotectant transport system permease protein